MGSPKAAAKFTISYTKMNSENVCGCAPHEWSLQTQHDILSESVFNCVHMFFMMYIVSKLNIAKQQAQQALPLVMAHLQVVLAYQVVLGILSRKPYKWTWNKTILAWNKTIISSISHCFAFFSWVDMSTFCNIKQTSTPVTDANA